MVCSAYLINNSTRGKKISNIGLHAFKNDDLLNLHTLQKVYERIVSNVLTSEETTRG